MNKADEKALGSLHGKLAEVLKDALSQDFTDPETGINLPPAAILNVARQFLKDNKIEAVAAQIITRTIHQIIILVLAEIAAARI